MRSRHIHLKLKCLVPGTPWKTQYWKLSLWGTKSLHTNYQENELFFRSCAAQLAMSWPGFPEPGQGNLEPQCPGQGSVPRQGGMAGRPAQPQGGEGTVRQGWAPGGRDEHPAAGTSTWDHGGAGRAKLPPAAPTEVLGHEKWPDHPHLPASV